MSDPTPGAPAGAGVPGVPVPGTQVPGVPVPSMPGPPARAASVQFDPRPLTEPVDPAAVRQFARRLQAEGRIPSFFSAQGVLGIVVAAFVGSVFVLVFGSIFVPIFFTLVFREGGTAFWLVGALVPVLVIGGIIAVIVVTFVRRLGRSREFIYRLDQFARANAMSYLPSIEDPPLSGMIFGLGHSRMSQQVLRGDQPRFVEFANYRYTTGSGKESTTHAWGYVAIHLDTPLPHIVLDALSNNGLFGSNLPASFDKAQRLSLEGDFDRYFALYCPQGYERDALYLFTPDIMARFIDNAAALDVEIVDDWMFLYAKRDFSTLDPATWAWLFTVVAALIDKVDRWARWRDERLAVEAQQRQPVLPGAYSAPGIGGPDASAAEGGSPGVVAEPAASFAYLRPPPGVAPEGRRLHRAIPRGAVIFGAVIVGIWLVWASGTFGPFFSIWFD